MPSQAENVDNHRMQIAALDYTTLLKQAITASLYPESAWLILRRDSGRNLRSVLKSWVIRQLAARNFVLVKQVPYDDQQRQLGRDWPMFGYSMVGHRRLENLEFCLRSIVNERVNGDFVECGVWRGGASIFAKAILNLLGDSERVVWLADSFEGMPVQKEQDKADFALAGNEFLAVSLEIVRENFERFGLLDDKVKFIKGWFSDTLHKSSINNIAVLRLDGDYYSSTMDVLDALYDKVSTGGYIIVDDYDAFVSCRTAIQEFLAARSIKPAIIAIDGMAVYWRKT